MSTSLCSGKVYDAYPLHPERYFGGISKSRILDIGCGTGRLGEFLRSKGNECFGITISDEEAEIAKNRLNRVIVTDIETTEELPFENHFFDIAIFADVLEHTRNPEYILGLIRTYLKPNGLIIVSVPNVANIIVRLNLLGGRFDYENFGIMDNSHLHFYTLKTARSLLKSMKFEITNIKFTNQNWRFPNWIARPFSFCEWEVRERMTRWWPELFATQFVFYARPKEAGYLQ